MSELDPCTGEGFREIAEAFGKEKAWEARIARLEQKIAHTQWFRWHSRRWERALVDAKFQLDWLRRKGDDGELPGSC